MDKEKICRDYMVLAEKIAEEFQERHVPNSVQAYYLLCELLSGGSIDFFIRTYGHRRLDAKSANEGKQIMNLGRLDDFEVATIGLLNEALGKH